MELSKEEIIRMAREAGVYLTKIGYEFDTDDLCRFAALVAANEKKFWMEQIDVECNEAVLAEREACAKVCDKEMDDWDYQSVVNVALNNCAAAIRARGE